MTDNVILGDCVEVMKSMPSESVDLVIMSPPYDKIRDYGKDWDIDLHAVGQEVYRLLKDGGITVMVIQDQTKDFAKSLTSFRTIVDWCDSGLRLFECLLYQRSGTPGAWWNKRFRVDHEYMPVFVKGARPRCFDKSGLMVPSIQAGITKRAGGVRKTDGETVKSPLLTIAPTKCRGTIWDYEGAKNSRGDKLKAQHPATFPDQLAKDHILCWTQPGDTVLDPFAGSGTTLVMAKQTGRVGIGIEINPEYCEIIKQRLSAA